MLPVVGRVVFGANHVVATPRLPTQGARNVPNPARRVVVIRSSGFGSAKPTEGIRVPRRVCCLSVRKSTSWNHVSASAVWGSTVANAKQPQPSWKRGNDTHRRHTRVVGATAANRFDAVAQTTPDSGVDERVPPLDQDEGVSQQTRTAYALIMVICVGATLLIAQFAAVPLPDLPRPETWALLHPTSVGFRGLQSDWGGFLRLCDYTGTALFAQSGVVAAGKKGMDFLGCLIVGCITAMGGGTFRGFVLGERPVFWAAEPEYLFISLAASVLTFFVWPGLERWLLGRGCTGNTENDAKKHTKNEANLEECLNWFDAVSIGAFCVIGANNGLRGANGSALIAIACGMFTASFGGIIRDTFCGKPPRILHSYQEAYASVTMIGACAYISLSALQVSLALRIAIPIALVVGIRKFAWSKGLRLPTYKER